MIGSGPFFVSCKNHRRCEAITEVESKAEQARLQHVWACDACASGKTPAAKRSPRQRQYRAEQRAALRQPESPTARALVSRVDALVDAYSQGREDGYRAGWQAREAELATAGGER